MSAETCPVCGKPVTEARDSAGGVVLLAARPCPFSTAAATAGGLAAYNGVSARLLPLSGTLRGGEKCYRLHRCAGKDGGLTRVRAAQSARARALRSRRGSGAR